MTNPTLLSTEASAPANSGIPSLFAVVSRRLARRGWQFRERGAGVDAHRPEWPAQLWVRAFEASADSPALVGLAIDLGAMPLRGERFRDIFNSEREELLRGYGSFRVQQLTGEGAWLKPITGRAFIQGLSDGLSRRTRLAVLDRVDNGDVDIVERFAADSNLMVECGAEIASLLQRVYQRTVLSAPSTEAYLPDMIHPPPAILPLTSDGEPAYPWRR